MIEHTVSYSICMLGLLSIATYLGLGRRSGCVPSSSMFCTLSLLVVILSFHRFPSTAHLLALTFLSAMFACGAVQAFSSESPHRYKRGD